MTTVVVDAIPDCDFCRREEEKVPGPYDFKTVMGPWAHGCERHWMEFRASETLGTGKGQLWVLRGSEDSGS